MTSYGVTFGYGYPRNAQFVTLERMTAVQAEYLAILGAAHNAGGSAACHSVLAQQVHVNMSVHFSTWEARGWVDDNDDPILGATTLTSISKLLSERPMPLLYGL